VTAHFSETATAGGAPGGEAEEVFLFPLSFAQQRLWFLDQLEPGNPFYNISTAVRLRGRLDVAALARTLRELVRRHESLRTTFSVVGGEPMQVISPAENFSLPLEDLSLLGRPEREAELERLAGEEAQRPFDLSTGPLLRARLLRLGAEEHAALFTMHHIVSDAWSLGVLVREVATLYAAYTQGRPPTLDELPLQYADFADWQRGWMQGEVLERELQYWRRRLAGAPPVLELPTDRPRPAVKSFRGATHSFLLPRELAARLRRLSHEEGATLFMTLLAAWQALLSRYTGQEDVVVGSPIAGRNRAETEGLIGFFVNTLALRTDLSGEPTFREILKRVREVSLGAFAHQDVPFEKLVEELAPARSLSHTPLFQVAFALQNAPVGALELPGLELSRIEFGAEVEKFDMTLSLTEGVDSISGIIGYDTGLFDAATVERMAGHFRLLLEAVASSPEARPAALPLLTAAERRRLLVEWNDTAREREAGACVHELFEAQAALRPGALAVACGDERLTYGELNERANRLARLLRGAGVGREDLVCILLERSAETAVCALAVLKAGAAYVPLDPSYPPDRLSFMLEDARAKVLLTRERLSETLRGRLTCPAVCLDRDAEEIARHDGGDLARASTRDNLAYVIYTSGSTGRPKGVQVTHGSLLNLARWHQEAYGVNADDRATQLASVGFDASVWELWPYLTAGASLHVPEEGTRASAEALREWLAGRRVTITFLPTPLAESVLALEGPRETALRYVLTGGDQLRGYPPPSLGFTLVNHYGPTESTVVATSFVVPCAEDALTPPPIGRPIANTRVYLLDRRGEPTPTGVAGELYIGGDGLARGYHQRPALTAERFVPDTFSSEPGARLYRTGDVARWLPGGELEFLGRADSQVKVRGYRIELGEVEAALRAHASVRECVCVVKDDERGLRRLVAYVVGAEGAGVTRAELAEHLGRRLPEHMIPSAFVTLEAMPLTPNGKLDRRALPEPVYAGAAGEFVAPRTPVEEVLCGVFAQVLGVERVGAHDNFFELGGHSLLATQLMSRVRSTFRVEAPLRALFGHPTAAELARHVEAALRAGAGVEAPPVTAVGRGGALPLSFAQQRLWFLDQLQPGGDAYNVPVAARLNGPLDAAALARVLTEVVRRHESLRTTFREEDGEPAQVIHDAAPVALPVEDLCAFAEAERESEARRLAAEEARRPFDLSAGPLLRARLLKLSEEEHVLLFTMHHIVTDGWSMGILVNEVATLYTAFLKGEESPLPELPVQYADFAAWQREWMQGEVLERELQYWRTQLEGAPPVLELPTDKPRPAVQTFRGAAHSFALPQELAERLRRLSREEGATLFMTLLAGFQALLSRYSGQEDVVVGSPIANRNRAEVEPLIGFFVNTLAMRTDLSGEPTFKELLRRVRETCLGAYAHQELPFEKLVEELEPERSLSHTPLFQVMFSMQSAPGTGAEFGELSMSGVAAGGPVASKFDLMLTAQEAAGGEVECGWVYNTDLYEPQTIERLSRHLVSLLDSAAQRPGRAVSSLQMLSEAERRRQLVEWNRTAREYPRELCAHELFEEQAARTPGAVAVVFGDERLTYAELNGRANRLARYLRGRGVGPESQVCVLLERGCELVVALLAVMKAGGAYVPVDPQYPEERLRFIVEDTRARVLLTQQKLAGRAPSCGAEVLRLDLDRERVEREGADNLSRLALPENLVYVLYTSGSTGRPKGVMISHAGLVNYLSWAKQAYVTKGHDAPVHSSIGFDLTVTSLYLPLLTGQSVVMLPEERGVEGLSNVLRGRGDFSLVKITPSHLELLSQDAEAGEAETWTGALVIGGDALFAENLSFWREHAPGVRLINEYGPTETVVGCAVHEVTPEAPSTGPIPIGHPIANTELYLFDARLRLLPDGAVGELYIGGDGLARGYIGRPGLTAERFIPHPFAERPGARLYKTGDLARRLPDGQLEYLGRGDNQVKVRGYRIELGEVEAALAAHPAVRTAVVEARGARGEKSLVAFVVCDGGARADELREWMLARVPEYMTPSAFVELEEAPLTANGKVDRRALPEVSGAQSRSSAAFVAPRDVVELRLCGIWEGVLGVAPVGVRDRFFDLGGHSLAAARLMHRVEQGFGRRLPLAALFESPTVEHLAGLLRRGAAEADAPFSPLVEIQPNGERPPFFCVHPSGGNVLCYAGLSRLLGADQPFYGLQARGLDARQAPHESVEEMARYYVAHLRAARPEGPYLLGGWSMGGVVAYEMARQLEAQGAEVALLALLDSAPLAPRAADWDELSLLRAFALDMGLAADEVKVSAEELAALGPEGRIGRLLERAVQAGVLPPDVAPEEALRLFGVFKANVRAMSDYAPKAGRVPATLFRAAVRGDASHDPLREPARDAYHEVREVPGSHFTIVREPHVRALAEELRGSIERALARRAPASAL
jgi:amino acid adenylation domain-containing protein